MELFQQKSIFRFYDTQTQQTCLEILIIIQNSVVSYLLNNQLNLKQRFKNW